MATLVSAGVSVTVTDESFFIPASAPTVPLFFIATADEKLQSDGVTPAEGTYEYDVVRTVTSLSQSTQLYGIPRFIEDAGTGQQHHGDARNEYGVFALNQFMGVGNRAYVVRTNVNLNDNIDDIRSMWDDKFLTAKTVLENLINEFIGEYNLAHGFIAGSSSLIAAQTHADFDGVGDNGSFTGGDGVDGTAYAAGDTITLSNGATITVGTVDAGTNATLTVAGVTSPDDDILYTAVSTGFTGNDVSIEYVVSGLSTPLSVAVVGNAITITVATDAGGLATSTAGEIVTAITNSIPASALVTASLVSTGTGVHVAASVAAQNLTGGGNGDVVSFTVTTVGTNVSDGVPLTQSSTSGTGTGFTLTPGLNNIASYKQTVTAAELLSLADSATADIFNSYSFISSQSDYFDDQSAFPFDVYANGYDLASTGTYSGLTDIATNIGSYPSYPGGATVAGEFTPTEGGDLLVATSDEFKYTVEFMTNTSLGSNDAARRVAIATAFAASINSNTEIRSENFDYNLILCPGYPEVVDELAALVTDINDEALVIADTPMDLDPDGVTNPSTGWAGTTARVRSPHVAYYYPSALASNLDGKNVVVAASGVALRTYTYNDNVAYLWTAPAGLRRGLITGITGLGYVDGSLGNPTTFVEVNLNNGQRDALYQYGAASDINPLVFFPGQGFVVWGQKTSAVAASAMDRVNVSRLIKYIKRQLRRNTLSFVFEPNDQLTRDNLKAVVDGFLGDLIVKRGLYDFATICDESNNTPDRIDRNEMYIDVALKPVKAAEFIYIPIRIVSTDAEI